MNRFFIKDIKISEGMFNFENQAQVRQISRVLRLMLDNEVVIFDGQGKEYLLKIEKISKDIVSAKLVKELAVTGDGGIKINLFMAIISRDKFELIAQKAAELGCDTLTPIKCERCQPFTFRADRLAKIIIEATEQSGGRHLLVLSDPLGFKEAVLKAGAGVVAWEGEQSLSLKEVLENDIILKTKEINLFIGPEGGLTPDEINFAKAQGLMTFSLGTRILRAETAAIAAIAIIQELGR